MKSCKCNYKKILLEGNGFMKSNYKKITSHGSISIPVAMRRELGILEGDPVELKATAGGEIMIKQYQQRCIFCSGTDKVHSFYGKGICNACIESVVRFKEESEHGND